MQENTAYSGVLHTDNNYACILLDTHFSHAAITEVDVKPLCNTDQRSTHVSIQLLSNRFSLFFLHLTQCNSSLLQFLIFFSCMFFILLKLTF